MQSERGRRRVVIENVSPEIDAGRFPIKRTVGEQVVVEADVFADGHDALACILLYRQAHSEAWSLVAMTPLDNDRWRGSFPVTAVGVYRYTLQAWVDRFATWRRALRRRLEASQDITMELLVGADIVLEASQRAPETEAVQLRQWAAILQQATRRGMEGQEVLEETLALLMARYPDTTWATTYDRELTVVVDRTRARFSTWYELFPRSCAPVPGQHGTLQDCLTRLPALAAMGFDVLYFPPIHPIGTTHRKGRNNALVAAPDDPGSPWAIGTAAGGHTAIHPQLGTLEDFHHLRTQAAQHGIELALDLALQCAPDHPYVREHPEWFRWRPDGTIQYAENPPKKYEDIYPFAFETPHWPVLWEELKRVVLFWIAQGIRIFRVDNPHTKPLCFWEWLIGEVKAAYPEVIFLAEAFTRPKVMYRLAKLGFTQSYTYFAWRQTAAELTQYFTELTQTPVREYLRPNLWPNTPDILTEYLQFGGRPAFISRLVLAATLGASYGLYGPAFELCEAQPREPGSEEYLDAEKYAIKHWEVDSPHSLREVITRVNRIRREHPALQQDWRLQWHPTDNSNLLCYSKQSDDGLDTIVVAVNLDPHHTQSGWVELALPTLALSPDHPYQMHDLLSDARYLWHGARNAITLQPEVIPAAIFQVRKKIRTEHDFAYYL